MVNPSKWGIISTANIGRKQVIPAMQQSDLINIVAIASRNMNNAQKVAHDLGIPKAYGSYQELLADSEIDAVYNPLPNHLHVPVTIQALEAGKHVLCEKPISLTAEEAGQLVTAEKRTGKIVGEAFMVRSNPQWQRVVELVQEGAIGELKAIQGVFSYFNSDPSNIRNMSDIGGGGIYDIGCYLINTSRMVTGEEPTRVAALIERDPVMKTDRLASGLMVFPGGVQATWMCSTQCVSYQTMNVFGTKGRIHIQVPFNAPNDRPCKIFIDDGSDLFGVGIRTEAFPVNNQYRLQGEVFHRAITEGSPLDMTLESTIANMKVIDAVFKAGETGEWINL